MIARLGWTLRDGYIVAGRNMRHFMRQPQLLLFSYVFGGAIGGSLPEGVSYKDFLLPGILIQSTSFRATQTAIGLSEDMKRGVIDRFRSMPMARSAVLAGRTLADLVRTIFVIALMIGVGYAIGFRFEEGVPSAIASIVVVAAFGFALSWIFAYVGLIAKGPEAAQSAGFVAIFPLVFASSIFVPVDTMPSFLQSIADVSPVTATADAARALAIGGDVWDPLWQVMAWVGGILLVFVPLCVRKYRRLQ